MFEGLKLMKDDVKEALSEIKSLVDMDNMLLFFIFVMFIVNPTLVALALIKFLFN
jgi:hypothetical protein